MPQPIDPQTEIGRITAAERIQQLADRASLAAQSRQSSETEQQRLIAESQVRQTRQKNEEVDEDLRRRNPYMGRRKRKREDGEADLAEHTLYAPNDHDDKDDAPIDHDFDITI